MGIGAASAYRGWGGGVSGMSFFTLREQADALVVSFDSNSGLNDFRDNGLRDALYDLIQSRKGPKLALNLEQFDFLSSSAIAILIGLKRRSENVGGKVVLFHVQPSLKSTLKTMKLDKYFTMADDEPSAVSSLSSASAE